MSKTNLRIVSAITSLALLAGTAGVASIATLASAAAPQVTTQAATNITTGDATLHGTNGDTDATGSAFWVSTSTFSVASSSSPSLPAGVFSTGDIGAVASSTGFAAQLSSATIPSGLMPITANTTYYYTAWSNVGGVWYPGAVMSLNTLAPTSTPTTTVSNVAVSGIGTSSATISWTSNNAGSSQVFYGTSASYGSSTTIDNTASTTHSAVLSGLSSGTTYHFAVVTGNGSTTATSTDATFITQSTSSSTPLHVDSISTVSASASADNSYADGWKWVMHLTVPDTENAFRVKFSDWAMNSTTSFPANGNMRLSIAQASNASTTGSGMTANGNGYSDWFYLTGDSEPSVPGRQIDLTIEVKIPVGTAAGAYTTTYTAQSWAQNATSTATQ